MEKEVISRFSDRVQNYIRYRPNYPDEMYDFLFSENLITEEDHIADIGSGTGILCEPLLKRGIIVSAVEPNREMREAAEKLLSQYKNFKSINGTAENTGLSDNSIDSIIAGQAFHWFDRRKCKSEFTRIIKPGGFVALIWNDRRTDTTDFLKVYEDFLQMFGTDYAKVNHKNIQDEKILSEFFGDGKYREKSFYNYQDVDFTGLKGRVLSASYMPTEQHPDFNHMRNCLKKIFLRYQENGKVRLDYDTRVYYGVMKELNHKN